MKRPDTVHNHNGQRELMLVLAFSTVPQWPGRLRPWCCMMFHSTGGVGLL